MRYRKLGGTGLLVSELCLGSNTFGGGHHPFWKTYGGLDEGAAAKVVSAAIDAGINFIDTADVYAAGESEVCVGSAIASLGLNRSDVVIATKGGMRMGPAANSMGTSRAHLTNALEGSLRRLGTDHIDLYMVHLFDAATPMEETLRTLDDFVRSGKVRYIGCSNYAAWQVMKGLQISRFEGLERFQVLEANWSAATRSIETEVVPMARDQQVGLLIWGAMLGGVLSGKYVRDAAPNADDGSRGGNIPAILDRDQVFDVIDALKTVATRHGATIPQTALAWLLHHKDVTSVLFGARRPEQVSENVAATGLALGQEDMDLIEAVSPPSPDFGIWSVQGSMNARLEYAQR